METSDTAPDTTVSGTAMSGGSASDTAPSGTAPSDTTAPDTAIGRPSWALALLTWCAFVLSTGEMMIAGLLPEIAADAGVPLPTAGLLVSVFALTVVVGGPVLALTTTAVRRRRLPAVLLALFFGPTADVVPEHRRGAAAARVSLGLGLATIAGLPVGTAIGQWLSWRATFVAVALLAAVAAGPLLALARAPHAPAPAGSGRGEVAA
ncbi:MFS transporter [Streptomyces sp. Ac-502]|uniref:MFS transporter n=1 Tax=Streptomyces sp. Ac-502 TaxID=3342801 RepID=UPI00386286B1